MNMKGQFHLTEVETLSALERQRHFIEGLLSRPGLPPAERIKAERDLQIVLGSAAQLRSLVANDEAENATDAADAANVEMETADEEFLFFLLHAEGHDAKLMGQPPALERHEPKPEPGLAAAATLACRQVDDVLHVHNLSILQAGDDEHTHQHILSAIERYAASKKGICEVILKVPAGDVAHYRERHGYEPMKTALPALGTPEDNLVPMRKLLQIAPPQGALVEDH